MFISEIDALDTLIGDEFINFPDGFFSILSSMVSKNHKEMCLVGRNIFAVTVDGDIYPCHMNTGNDKVCLGNIQGENAFTNKIKYKNKFPALSAISKTKEPCILCWANPICGGCAIYWFFDEKRDKYMHSPNETLCRANKKHVERILLLIYKLRKNPQKWSELLKILKYNNSPYSYVD